MEQKQPKVLLESSLKLKLPQDQDFRPAEALLSEVALELKPKYGGALTYAYRDITSVQAEDYRIIITFGKTSLELFHLGNKYRDFVRTLIYQRNELILTDMLMQERLRRGGITASCAKNGDNGQALDLGTCELRLCDTALLIIPEYFEPIRLPFCYVSEVTEYGYALTIATELGDEFTISKLGREYTPFTQLLSEALNELSVKAQGLLRDLVPTAAPAAIQQASQLMREGRAARRRDLEKIDPAMWKGLERQLDSAGIRQEYLFLNSKAGTNQQCIGFKRELVAQSCSEYIWFLIPIIASNVIAMEASSGPDSGRATYFFRISARADFPALESQSLQDLADQLLADINRCMLAINFRREPVYLPEAKLLEPKYHKYLRAVKRIPELAELRERFIGRVFHREPEQWEEDVLDLLQFNIGTKDNKAKWTKSDLETMESAQGENLEKEFTNGG